ncbi:MAG: hypothetical protein ACM3SY_13945 [Candidatus Omnitrophota bacterium]
MSYLKDQNIKKCLALLQEFVTDKGSGVERQHVALLALDQLKRITAGNVYQGSLPQEGEGSGNSSIIAPTNGVCNGVARIDYDPIP